MPAPNRALVCTVTSCSALLLTVAGCAARSKTVTLDVHATHPVTVAPIAMEPGAAKLVAVGTYKVPPPLKIINPMAPDWATPSMNEPPAQPMPKRIATIPVIRQAQVYHLSLTTSDR